MTDIPHGEQLVFGRYTRDQCGLPPAPLRAAPRRAAAWRAAAVLLTLILAGWLAGTAASRWRRTWLATLPASVYSADPAHRAALLARGRLYAASQAGDSVAAHRLAYALMVAAERSPRRMGYYGNIGPLLDRAGPAGGGPEEAFHAELAASGVYAELDEFPSAFACLTRADAALEKMPEDAAKRANRLALINTQAYYLATAPEKAGRNPEKALHLAQLLLSSRDERAPGRGLYASDSAAYMDTLATAWFAAGDAGKALAVQSLALGLAETAGLDVYLRHYDEFATAAGAAAPPETGGGAGKR